MAEKLKDFDFGTRLPTTGAYPWDEWTDGGNWKIVHGTDFACAITSMQAQLYQRAKAQGMKVWTSFVDSQTAIVFRFVADEADTPAKKAATKKVAAAPKPAATAKRQPAKPAKQATVTKLAGRTRKAAGK